MLIITERAGEKQCSRRPFYKSFNDLLRYCTADEIEADFKVLDLQIRLMQKGYYIDADGTVAFNYEVDKQ